MLPRRGAVSPDSTGNEIRCGLVTATRDRRSDLDDALPEVNWDERPVFGSMLGLPWWGAILLAVGLAVTGAVLDVRMHNSLGSVFQVAYLLGCVAAICLVRRKNLFGPMVQPPLILGFTVPITVLLYSQRMTAGLEAKALAIGSPLINSFPAMAIATVLTVIIGVARIFLQRPPAEGNAEHPQRGGRSRAGLSDRSAGARGSAAAGRKRRGAATRSGTTRGDRQRDSQPGRLRGDDPRDRSFRTSPPPDQLHQARPTRANRENPDRRQHRRRED